MTREMTEVQIMAQAKGMYRSRGYKVGLEISIANKIVIDLLAMRNGHLVIGEAKTARSMREMAHGLGQLVLYRALIETLDWGSLSICQPGGALANAVAPRSADLLLSWELPAAPSQISLALLVPDVPNRDYQWLGRSAAAIGASLLVVKPN